MSGVDGMADPGRSSTYYGDMSNGFYHSTFDDYQNDIDQSFGFGHVSSSDFYLGPEMFLIPQMLGEPPYPSQHTFTGMVPVYDQLQSQLPRAGPGSNEIIGQTQLSPRSLDGNCRQVSVRNPCPSEDPQNHYAVEERHSEHGNDEDIEHCRKKRRPSEDKKTQTASMPQANVLRLDLRIPSNSQAGSQPLASQESLSSVFEVNMNQQPKRKARSAFTPQGKKKVEACGTSEPCILCIRRTGNIESAATLCTRESPFLELSITEYFEKWVMEYINDSKLDNLCPISFSFGVAYARERLPHADLVENMMKLISLNYMLCNGLKIIPLAGQEAVATEYSVLRAQLDTKLFSLLYNAEKLVCQELQRLVFKTSGQLPRDALVPVSLVLWLLTRLHSLKTSRVVHLIENSGFPSSETATSSASYHKHILNLLISVLTALFRSSFPLLMNFEDKCNRECLFRLSPQITPHRLQTLAHMNLSAVQTPYAEPVWYSRNVSPHYTTSHCKLRAAVRKYVDEEILPHAFDWESAGKAFQRHAELGYLALGTGVSSVKLPGDIKFEEWDSWHTLIVTDELSRVAYTGVLWGLGGGNGIGVPPIVNFGTKEQKARKHDHYLVNGSKKWITNAIWADYVTAAVRTGGAGAAGISLLIIPLKSEGKISCIKRTAGLRSSCLISTLNAKQIATTAIRLSRVCAEDAWKHACVRETFGKKLIENPVIRAKFAKMGRMIEPAQAFLEQLTWVN
ncbi:hypothetical protein EYC84_002433 [Monilinia fructicola]|uniref:Uncharacterized protein n=1 Tax=Monilinia fructicola TaxID=38448 RepID=A0A5M9JN64_MONFR|nr:hypothetical protein EYC84_002433 [Monilinia fructicola]